jgi:MYXO-CTERM domain-containing protein
MEFFERYLGISPDGGSGATEAVYVAVVLLIALGAVLRWRRAGSQGI